MNHVADDRTRPNDGYLHDDVVKLLGPQSRKTRHLRAAFNLKQTNRVRLTQRVINRRVVLRKMSEIHFFSIGFAYQRQTFFNRSQHTEAE